MPAASSESILRVPQAQGRERGESGVDAPDRQGIPGVPLLWQPSDGPSSVAGRRLCGASPGAASDAPDGATGHLPGASHHPAAPRAGADAEAGPAPQLACLSAGSTGTAGHVKQNPGGMIDDFGIHLISAAHLSSKVGPPHCLTQIRLR